jgi:multiple sugar transport system permease protein
MATQTDRTKWFFLLPAIGWILIFSIFPLLYAIYTSFFSFTTAGKRNQFVGLDNFARLFEDANLHQGLMTTLRFVIATVSVEMILGVLLALLLNREIRGKNILRAIMTLPLFATPVAVGYLAITLYYEEGGPINSLIQFLGGGNIPWLSHPTWAQVAIIIVDIWQWTPFVFLVTLAALQGLPQDLYEAAKVDGASTTQLFWRITLPLLRPTLWLVLMLRMIEAFKVNDIPYSLTLGGPGQATKVFTMFTYETSRRFKNHGYGAAQSFLLLVIVSLLVALLWGRIREMYEDRR